MEAVTCYRRALELMPDTAEVHNNLGNVLVDQEKLDEAIACFRRAVKLKPHYAEAHYNLGHTLAGQGKLAEAVIWYCRALELKPRYAEAHNNLGHVFAELGQLNEAVVCFRKAMELNPDIAEVHNNLGHAFQGQGKLDDAVACYRRALELKPDYAKAHDNLGTAFQEQGKLDEAIASFRQALASKPGFALPYARVATLLRGKLPESDRIALEERIADLQLNQNHRSQLLFALAHVLDARGDYTRAADLLRQANSLRLELNDRDHAYLPAEHEQFVDNVIRAFDRQFFARFAGDGLDTRRPVFIVGLPRSGTTLMEQVLGSHSRIYGAGELYLGRQSFEAMSIALGRSERPIDGVSLLNSGAIASLSKQHIEWLSEFDGGRVSELSTSCPTTTCIWDYWRLCSREQRSFIVGATFVTWPFRAG